MKNVLECKCTFSVKKAYRQGVCCAVVFHLTAGMGELGTAVTHEVILDMKRQILLSNHNSRHLQDSMLLVCLNSAASSGRLITFLLSVVLVSIQLSSLKGRSSFSLIFILLTSLNSSLRETKENVAGYRAAFFSASSLFFLFRL